MFHKTHPGESDRVGESQTRLVSDDIPTEITSACQHHSEIRCQIQGHQHTYTQQPFLGHDLVVEKSCKASGR